MSAAEDRDEDGGAVVTEYLLSTYAVGGAVPGAPTTDEEMRLFMERVAALEADMDAHGAFVFGGALLGPEASTLLTTTAGEPVSSDGPFVGSNEQIAGFYIIRAADLDAARAWGRKVADATNHPIELRPFRATGRLKA